MLEEILAVDRGLAPDESALALARHSSREGAPPSPAEEVVEELLEDLASGAEDKSGLKAVEKLAQRVGELMNTRAPVSNSLSRRGCI